MMKNRLLSLLLLFGAGTSSKLLAQNVAINNIGNMQLNIQNKINGNSASSNIVATANNGTASAVYINMGINGGVYIKQDPSPLALFNRANTAYLYATGADFYVGNSALNKDLVFFTNSSETKGGYGIERLRINDNGKLPATNNLYFLGSESMAWANVYSYAYTTLSDKTVKSNILKLQYGLKEILKLEPVTYDWKTNPGPSAKIGLIAQDVKKILPEVVVGNETKENIGINYSELVPVPINAIKEQQHQIDDLKKTWKYSNI